jgi:hypothetical protein
MESVTLLENLFDNKILNVLKLFVNNEDKKYYLREVSRLTNTSAASTYRILNKLVDLQVLKLIKIKKTKLYTLSENKNLEFLKSVLKIEKRVIDYFVERAKEISEVDAIVLHGKKQKDRANLLLIGGNIDSGKVKILCAEIKEKYNFTITTLQLQREQFEQMSAMGLYSGGKKVLFTR